MNRLYSQQNSLNFFGHEQCYHPHIDCSFQCPICAQEVADEPIQLIECNHTFCRDCLRNYLESQISNLKVMETKCPQEGCSHSLNDQFIQEILDTALFEKYQYLVLQKTSHRSSQLKFCPKPGCLKPITPSFDSKYTSCKCKTLICNLCGDFWHEGKTCLEAYDPEFNLYAQENNLKCCLMCKTALDKVEGCIHITCPICDYEWCWLCGREYTKLHDKECIREWSPLPPDKIIAESANQCSSKQLKIYLKKVGKFLLLAPIQIILWPYWLLNVQVELSSPYRPFLDKLLIICVSLSLVLTYIALLGLLLFLAWSENTVLLDIIFVFVLIFPWILSFASKAIERFSKKKRWMIGDVQNFVYTGEHRPRENLSKGQRKAEIGIEIGSFGRQE